MQDRGPSGSETGEVEIGRASRPGVASGSMVSCDLEGEAPINSPISMESPRCAVLMT
jgi:hypothetical protein